MRLSCDLFNKISTVMFANPATCHVFKNNLVHVPLSYDLHMV